MRAIILAAGSGTRLKRYTRDLPKGMLSFLGKTIIERQLETYRSCGIDDVCVVRGFAADKISYPDVRYHDNADYASTNMVESLLCAREEFDDDAIVSYSDVLFEPSMLRAMMSADADFACAVDDAWEPYWVRRYGRADFDTESLVIGADGNVVELGLEDPPRERIDARYVGLLRFSREGLATICETMDAAYAADRGQPWQQSGRPVRQAYMTDLLNELIRTGHEVRAVRFEHGWIEFDTNEDYEQALAWARDGSLGELIEL